jgi:hypothetical protein
MPRPRKSQSERRVGLAVYMSPRVKKALERAAKESVRSASTQALLYIEEGLGLRKRR